MGEVVVVYTCDNECKTEISESTYMPFEGHACHAPRHVFGWSPPWLVCDNSHSVEQGSLQAVVCTVHYAAAGR